jgi:hypothetical protein
MAENTSLILTAVATAFAAVAAWCSFEVARRSLEFQKTYAKNQDLINDLNRTIYKVETLQILILKPLEISDTEHESLEPLLNELKSSLERLNNRNIISYESLKIHSIENYFGLAKDHSCLDEVINELEKIKTEIYK